MKDYKHYQGKVSSPFVMYLAGAISALAFIAWIFLIGHYSEYLALQTGVSMPAMGVM